MATRRRILKLTTILSFIISLTLTSHSRIAFSNDIEDDEEYAIDTPFINNMRSRSRFLANVIKKGARCDLITNNICNGLRANNGTSLLHCCKKHCCNTLGDRNNCGLCGEKCQLGELCCHGTCTNIAYNATHCGKCDNKCLPGLKCEYGTCGYA